MIKTTTCKYIITGLFLYSTQMFSQTQGVVKGFVKDASTNESLPSTVIALDKKNGTAVDFDGNYIINTTEGEHTLECELVGYKKFSKTITVKANDTLVVNIVLEDGNKLLDEVVVSAGKFEQKLSDVTVSMDVIKPTLIENKASTSLDIVMNQVPGVVVSDGNTSIRGGSGYSYGAGTRVLMLVDEMPMISADAADIKWNYLPLENLEQVEVIKGASSALFGSSALNGVINMRTAYAKDKPITTVSMFGASFDSPKNTKWKWWKGTSQFQTGVNFGHSEKIGNFDIVLGGHLFDDDGYRKDETERRSRFNANLRYNFKKIQGLSIGVNTNMMRTATGIFFLWQSADSALIPSGSKTEKYRNSRFNIDPFITYFTKSGGKFSLRTRYYLTNNTNTDGKASRAELYYSEFQYQKRFKNNLNLTTGLVYMEQQVIADSLYGRHTGVNYAGYVQLDYKYKKLTASLGLRGEYNRVDTSFTRGYISKKINNLPFQPVARFGLNYHLFEYTFLRASFGQGYRFPSIAEKYVTAGVSAINVLPNPGLQPERGWTSEIAVKQGFKVGGFKGFLDVAGFYTKYSNMIEFVFDVYGTKTGLFYLDIKNAGFKSQNVGDAVISGFDISVSGTGKVGPINVTTLTGYTFMNPINPNYNAKKDTLGSLPNSNLLKYRNKHLFKGDIQLDYKKLSVGYSVRYFSYMENIDKRFEQSILHEYNDLAAGINWDEVPSTYVLPGLKEYRASNKKGDWISDVRISYQLTKALKTSFIINNVTNEEYSSRPGAIGAPRLFMLQMMLKI